MYQYTVFGSIQRLSDGAVIPADPDNTDYQAVLKHLVEGGAIAAYSPPAKTLDELKADKLIEINRNAVAVASALTDGYPDFEMQTWPQQEAEARAWNINNESPTPMIDVMAATRGIPRTLFLMKTIEKVTMFRQASAYLVGLRQKYEDQVKAAKTAEEVQAIEPVYPL